MADDDVVMVSPAASGNGGESSAADNDTETDSSISTTPLTSRKSPAWAYFTMKGDNKDWVTCDTCGIIVKCKDSNTSNLFGHLERKHPDKFALVQPSKATKKTSCSKSKTKTPSVSPAQTTIASAFEKQIKYTADSDRATDITKAITRYLVSGESGNILCPSTQ